MLRFPALRKGFGWHSEWLSEECGIRRLSHAELRNVHGLQNTISKLKPCKSFRSASNPRPVVAVHEATAAQRYPQSLLRACPQVRSFFPENKLLTNTPSSTDFTRLKKRCTFDTTTTEHTTIEGATTVG